MSESPNSQPPGSPKLTKKQFLVRFGDGDEAGPMPASELRSLAESGKLERADLVSVKGVAHWVKATEVAGLFSDAEGLGHDHPSGDIATKSSCDGPAFEVGDEIVHAVASESMGYVFPKALRRLSESELAESRKYHDAQVMTSAVVACIAISIIITVAAAGILFFVGFSLGVALFLAAIVFCCIVVSIIVFAVQDTRLKKRDPKYALICERLELHRSSKRRADALSAHVAECLVSFGAFAKKQFGQSAPVSIAAPCSIVAAGPTGLALVDVEADQFCYVPSSLITEVKVDTRLASSTSQQQAKSGHYAIYSPLGGGSTLGTARLAASIGETVTTTTDTVTNEYHTVVDIYTSSELGSITLNFLGDEAGGKAVYNTLLQSQTQS